MLKLDRLNELLADKNLDLPDFRRKVDVTGNNISWLQRNLEVRNKISPELRELVALDIKKLRQ